jgi:hypothetical protein
MVIRDRLDFSAKHSLHISGSDISLRWNPWSSSCRDTELWNAGIRSSSHIVRWNHRSIIHEFDCARAVISKAKAIQLIRVILQSCFASYSSRFLIEQQ